MRFEGTEYTVENVPTLATDVLWEIMTSDADHVDVRRAAFDEVKARQQGVVRQGNAGDKRHEQELQQALQEAQIK